MTAKSDASLMQSYRGGNAAAFDQLYERHRLAVFNYLYRHLGQAALAEDIFQDVWLRVIRAADQWQANSSFTAWLFRIAHNRLVDHWRSQRNDASLPNDELQADGFQADEVVADRQSSVEHSTLLADCLARLQQLLARLKPDQRDVFVLQQEAGLTLEQIAQVTAVGRETVKSRLRYALQKLRAGLEGCDD